MGAKRNKLGHFGFLYSGFIDNTGWQFNRIFRPLNRPPKDGRRPKNEQLRVGDELDDDLGHDLGGQKILLNFHPGPKISCTKTQTLPNLFFFAPVMF